MVLISSFFIFIIKLLNIFYKKKNIKHVIMKICEVKETLYELLLYDRCYIYNVNFLFYLKIIYIILQFQNYHTIIVLCFNKYIVSKI